VIQLLCALYLDFLERPIHPPGLGKPPATVAQWMRFEDEFTSAFESSPIFLDARMVASFHSSSHDGIYTTINRTLKIITTKHTLL